MYMGKDLPDQGIHQQPSSCEPPKSNWVMNNNPSNSRCPITHPFFSADVNPQGQTVTGNMTHALLTSDFTPLSPQISLPTQNAVQRRFLIFDQCNGRMRLVLGPLNPPFCNLNCMQKHRNSCCIPREPHVEDGLTEQFDETNFSGGDGGEDMHEDTDEIDALLCSDSGDENSTRYTTIMSITSNEVVANSMVRAKRKRPASDTDPTLVDTATSLIRAQYSKASNTKDESSRVHNVENEAEVLRTSSPQKRLKRDQIWKTIGLLRKIIPGGREKDTTVLLDKAIQYLKSFKLKLDIQE